jgi:uncharacterized protein (TIGR02246 family)
MTMTRTIAAVLLLASVAFAQLPATSLVPEKHCSDPVDAGALAQIAPQWMGGYNNGDPDRVAALYAEDATYLTQHFATGIVHGRASIRAYVKKGTDAHYRVDRIDVLSTTCSGDFAYTITRYESTNGGQKAIGVNLVVLRKMNGKWLIVAHEAAVPDATAIQSLQPE